MAHSIRHIVEILGVSRDFLRPLVRHEGESPPLTNIRTLPVIRVLFHCTCIVFCFIASYCVSLRSIAYHCISLHLIAPYCISLRSLHLRDWEHVIACHCVSLRFNKCHCISLNFIALHCASLHFSAFHCIAKASRQAWLKLLIANEVRIGGPGGGGLKTDHFEALPHLILVAMAVDFEADVPCGNWVTVGFDSPLVRPSTCIGWRREWRVKWSKNGVKA